MTNRQPIMPPVPGSPDGDWVQLAKRVRETADTYRRVADDHWRAVNLNQALMCRGIAEGLDQALVLMRELHPDPVWTINQTWPASGSVEVSDGVSVWTLHCPAPDLNDLRIDRVTVEPWEHRAVMPMGSVLTGSHRLLRVTMGPSSGSPIPPALRVGQTHIGLILRHRAGTLISNNQITTAQEWK